MSIKQHVPTEQPRRIVVVASMSRSCLRVVMNASVLLIIAANPLCAVFADAPSAGPVLQTTAPDGDSQLHYAYPAGAPAIQQVQVTTDPRRPLDRRIEAMPKAEQKLEVIHHRSQLVVTRGAIRRMAWSDPTIIDVVQFSPTEISILGLELGTTDLWLWFEGQEQPLMYVLTVIRDPSLDEQKNLNYGRIERKLSLLYPNSKIYLIPMARRVIVRGEARDSEEAANIMQLVRSEVLIQEGLSGLNDYGVAGGGAGGAGFGIGGVQGGGVGGIGGFGFGNNLLNGMVVDEIRVPGEFQVMIRVRIAELQRSQLRRYGLDWSAIINNGAVSIGQSLSGGAGILTGIFDNGNITVLIDALASNGVAKIMDDARVVTISGQPAAFLSGGEFAVPTIIGIGGAQGQQTSFRGFGTSIICTPTILDHDIIRLQVVPELSEINSSNSVGGIPGLNVRRVQTRVELREGQSIVLGGVFSRREQAEVTRIPFLGEIPVVGAWIFNTKRATEDENEMLIIVTPEIVRPMDSDQVPPLPGWYSTHPNDCDFYKYNRIEGNPDLANYQLLPYGNGQGYGQDVGYNFFNPAPADGQIAPMPTGAAQGPYPQGVYPSQSTPAYGGHPQQPMYAPQMPAGGGYQPAYPAPPGGGYQPSYPAPPGGSYQPGYPAPPGNNSIPPVPAAEPTPVQSTQNGRYQTGVRQASGTSAAPRASGLWQR